MYDYLKKAGVNLNVLNGLISKLKKADDIQREIDAKMKKINQNEQEKEMLRKQIKSLDQENITLTKEKNQLEQSSELKISINEVPFGLFEEQNKEYIDGSDKKNESVSAIMESDFKKEDNSGIEDINDIFGKNKITKKEVKNLDKILSEVENNSNQSKVNNITVKNNIENEDSIRKNLNKELPKIKLTLPDIPETESKYNEQPKGKKEEKVIKNNLESGLKKYTTGNSQLVSSEKKELENMVSIPSGRKDVDPLNKWIEEVEQM